MSEEYLQQRKDALLNRLTLSGGGDIENTIEQIAEINLALDISTLAKEITLGLINAKLPNLSSGKIPVTVGSINLTADWRLLTETTVIPAGSCYVYLFVKLGDVTINGLTKTTGEYINLETSPAARHPEINIVIPAGKSVELIRGY